uniref:Putative patched transmembrane receptor n=1 Tax=Tabanus bromius TaxID=304241 RepID=A0A0K8TSG4_TABBR
MQWFYKLLTQRSCVIIAFLTILSSICILVALKTSKLPDFSDPSLGFEARGTWLGERITAWQNLLEELKPAGKLVDNPKDTSDLMLSNTKKKKGGKFIWKYGGKITRLKIKKEKHIRTKSDIHLNPTCCSPNTSKSKQEDHIFYGEETMRQYVLNETKQVNMEDKGQPLSHKVIRNKSRFFCESPNIDFATFVVIKSESNSADSFFGINSLRAMCDLENKITFVTGYTDYCQKQIPLNTCCRPWSLPNYIALLTDKTSCYEINQTDISTVEQILVKCYKYFHNLMLSPDCQRYKCEAPTDCTKYNAVYNILHFLTDAGFMKSNASIIHLTSAMLFVPIAKSMKILPLFHNMENTNLENNWVKVAAMDLGLKSALFDEYLLSDLWLAGVGGIFIIISMWLYTKSMFLTAMTVIAIFFSLGIAYFVYSFVLEMAFFPFMNLLAVIVVIGIGADDAFIFVKIWRCIHLEYEQEFCGLPTEVKSSTEANIMKSTLKHAALSMFVTSFTTAAAFYASYISSITAVKCFGVFAGTAVISNNILMMTWLPASVSIMKRVKCPFTLSLRLKIMIERIGLAAEAYIITAVTKTPILWMSLLGIIGISSAFLVLYWPRLQLPESPNFPLFSSNHPFELYEAKYRENFRFEQSTQSSNNLKLPLRFVWGVHAVDKGDFSNPFSKGGLDFDNNFNISSTEAQNWLLKFCSSLKKQSFYQKSFGMLLSNCFIENFIMWMSRKCFDKMIDMDKKPCCEISKFPYEPHIFEYCLPQSIFALYATPRQFFVPGVAGPKFGRSEKNFNSSLPPIVKALVIEYESNIPYSLSYTDIKNFLETVQKWFDGELLSAPLEMQGGWFISDLLFFNLQSALSTGTVVSIGIAMSVSLLILLLLTLNILISFYAVLTISLTIFTTIAVLIFCGWKMNILESISISSAVGLAVDFSLHYGIHYRLSPHLDRRRATKFALCRMIGPTAMSATTTIVAGALMLLSSVLPYIQIGQFLVVAMTFSWLYATFFLMSLLQLLGPQYEFMQLNYPWSYLKKQRRGTAVDKRIERRQYPITLSEQRVSSPSSTVENSRNIEMSEFCSSTLFTTTGSRSDSFQNVDQNAVLGSRGVLNFSKSDVSMSTNVN